VATNGANPASDSQWASGPALASSDPMSPLLVPWFSVCAVLAVAGAAKLRKPDPTMGALRAAGVPSSRALVRTLGAIEIALGAAGVATGAPLVAVAVAAFYVAFAAFVAASLRSGQLLQSCGCFGSPDVPATRAHVAVNLVAAATAFVAAATEPASLSGVLAEGASGLVLVGLSAVATFEVVLVLAVQPLVRADRLHATGAASW
jgi:hypothetical protein